MNETDAAPHSEPVVELRHVSLSLRGNAGVVPILQDIDLTIYKNETVALVGPSGSGKTSLLMLIAGLERASGGSISVAGRDITQSSEDALADMRAGTMGIVFQSFHLIPTLTALENVAIPLEFAQAADARERALHAIDALGLAHRAHHYPHQLSGGEQQRIGIARAFVGRPALLLADEPTGNLDAETGEQVIRLLFDLSEQHGTTLVLITHDMGLASRTSRILRMRDGRIAPHA